MRNDVCVECECVELCEEVESKMFRCVMLMLSGPVELLFFLFLIASWTCALVSCIYAVLRLLLFTSTTLSA